MTTCIRRSPVPVTLADGLEVVRVPLANSDQFATVDQADYDRLTELGLTDQWCLSTNGQNRRYVRCRLSGLNAHATVARAIALAGPGQVVRYLDGDRTNLRRANLSLTGGPAKGIAEGYLLGRAAEATIRFPDFLADPEPAAALAL